MPKPQVASSRRPQYVQFFRDRLGRQVCYYRRGTLRIRLRSEPPYTEAWWKEYAAARSGSPLLPDDGGCPPERGRNRPGSWNALIAKYTDSAPYKVLKPRTAGLYRTYIGNIGATWGDAIVRDTPAAKINKWIGDKSITNDGAARALWTCFSILCRLAQAEGWRPDNAMSGIKKPRLRNPEGYATVDEVAVARWRKRHAGNPDAMWVLEGLLGTGARSRSDFRMLGRKDILDGKIQFQPSKTDGTTGAWVRIPLRDKHLIAALSTRREDDDYFLQQTNGKPWDEQKLAIAFRKWKAEAGWPAKYKMHGLRKLFATRMANKGAKIIQIAAALGDTPESVRHYIKTRDTDDLAAQAIELIAERVA
jgi:integrase